MPWLGAGLGGAHRKPLRCPKAPEEPGPLPLVHGAPAPHPRLWMPVLSGGWVGRLGGLCGFTLKMKITALTLHGMGG